MAVVLKTRPADLLCFCHRRWSFVFHRPQHLMLRWARERRVFFIEEPMAGAPEPRLDLSEDPSGVRVVTPHLPDGLDDPAATLRDLIDTLASANELEEFISWYSTPMAIPYSRHLAPKAVVYDCIAELSLLHGAPPDLLPNESELLRRADVVFTGGHRLYQAKRSQHLNVHPFPSSVDFEHFSAARKVSPDPEDQAAIPHPRLGFYGVIDERFDPELVSRLADLRPDWHLVLLGPVVKIGPEQLPRRPNIHCLGSKPYAQLPQHVAGWDVALLPLAINDATRFISPAQTPEYLAAGLPVVSTPIHDVVHPYGELGLVHIAGSATQFAAAINASLTDDRAERLAQADAFLAELSWDRTWSEMKQEVERVRRKRTIARWVKPRFDYLVAGAGFSGAVMAERLAEHGKRVLLVDKRVAEPRDLIRNSEDVIFSKVGRELYEKFFRHYTFKQWGLWPSQLDPTVIARIPVRTNRDDRYFSDTFQAMPKERKPPRLENVHWTEPEQQLQQVKVLHSLEREGLTPVFGSTLPPRGLSGFIRRQAYALSENDLRHWLMLLFADRVNAVEGLVDDVRRSPRGRLIAGLAGAAALGGIGLLIYRRFSKRR